MAYNGGFYRAIGGTSKPRILFKLETVDSVISHFVLKSTFAKSITYQFLDPERNVLSEKVIPFTVYRFNLEC